MRHVVLLDLADGLEADLLVFDRIAPPAPNVLTLEHSPRREGRARPTARIESRWLAPPTQRQERVELADAQQPA